MHPPHTAPPTPPHLLGSSLRRSSTDRLVLGLCGGVARATGANATAVRLGTWAIAVILLPVALLGYLVTAVILPRDDGATLIGPGARDRRDVIAAVLATLVAAPVILDAADGSLLTTSQAFPIIALGTVLTGLAIILGRSTGVQAGGLLSGGAAGPSHAATAAPSGGLASDPFSGATTGPYVDATETFVGDAVTARSTTVEHETDSESEPETEVMPALAPSFVKASRPTVEIPGAPAAEDLTQQDGPDRPDTPRGPDGPGGTGGSGGDDGVGPHGGPTPSPAPRRRGLGMPVVSTIVLIPALFAVLIAFGIADSNASAWSVMLALMAVASAGGAVAIAFRRPSYLGAGLLVILAASFGALSICVNQLGPVMSDGIGERTYRPTGTDELRRPYLLGLGEMTIDLRDLDLARGTRTPIEAKLGFGHLQVIVPKGVRVVAAPASEVPGLTASATRTGASERDVANAPTIVLDVDVRGAQVDLLTGNAKLVENLTVLQSSTSGFWGTDDGSVDAANNPGAAASPDVTP